MVPGALERPSFEREVLSSCSTSPRSSAEYADRIRRRALRQPAAAPRLADDVRAGSLARATVRCLLPCLQEMTTRRPRPRRRCRGSWSSSPTPRSAARSSTASSNAFARDDAERRYRELDARDRPGSSRRIEPIPTDLRAEHAALAAELKKDNPPGSTSPVPSKEGGEQQHGPYQEITRRDRRGSAALARRADQEAARRRQEARHADLRRDQRRLRQRRRRRARAHGRPPRGDRVAGHRDRRRAGEGREARRPRGDRRDRDAGRSRARRPGPDVSQGDRPRPAAVDGRRAAAGDGDRGRRERGAQERHRRQRRRCSRAKTRSAS